MKKNQPLDEKTRANLSDIIKDIFGFGDPFTDFKRKYKPMA